MEQQADNREYVEYRLKRIKRIKRAITILLVVLLILPNLVNCYLLFKLNTVNRNLKVTKEQLCELTIQMEDMNAAVLVEQALSPIRIDDDSLREIVPDSQLYDGKRLVYLTFDDGPSEYTDEILDILAEYDVKATFFVLAKDGYEEEYQRIVDEGHTLALHSYTHQYSQIYESPQAFREDVVAISEYIYDITGYRCKFYRFPGGSSNTIVQFDKKLLFDILEQENLIYCDWNVTSKDASSHRLSSRMIVDNVINGVRQTNRAIVLMHDASDKKTTVEALSEIIETLLEDERTVFLPITEGTTPVWHVVSSEVTETD